MIDGWTDWQAHALWRGVLSTTPSPSRLVPLSCLQRDEPAKDMTLLCILWRVSRLVIYLSSTPSLPNATDRSFPWDTWAYQEVLISVPFASPDPSFPFSSATILHMHSFTLGIKLFSSLCQASSTNPPSLVPFRITLITHSNALFTLCLSFHPDFFSSLPVDLRRKAMSFLPPDPIGFVNARSSHIQEAETRQEEPSAATLGIYCNSTRSGVVKFRGIPEVSLVRSAKNTKNSLFLM